MRAGMEFIGRARLGLRTHGSAAARNPSAAVRAGRTAGATLAVIMLGVAAASAADGSAPPTGDAEALIATYGLRLTDAPVSKRPDWRKPRRIVVDAGPRGLENAVRSALPGVTVVAVNGLAEMVAAVPGADAAIGGALLVCNDAVLAAGTELRWLQVMTAGVEYCTSKPRIAQGRYLLTNMRAIAGPMIAEHTIGMLLALTRGLTVSLPRQATGKWSRDYDVPLVTVQGKTMLIAGLGGIGGEIARRANALGMRVIATRGSSRERPPYVDYVGLADELPTLLGQADVVVNALPLTEATRGLFNAGAFARMRPSAYFLNVGRGGTVVQADLVSALQSRRLAGAGLDVTDPEPLSADDPLWRAPNVLITPHNSSDADLGVEGQVRVLRENLRRYAAGERMLSVVDVARGY